MKYKVIFDRSGCIGAGQCETAYSERWEVVDDGKADLKGSKEIQANQWELIIDETELDKMMEAAKACPVLVIHIEELESGKRLI